MKTGAELIAEERKRQIEEEGWTAEHDDGHEDGELAIAAACYALDSVQTNQVCMPDEEVGPGMIYWPWEKKYFKPTSPDDDVRQLAKAGALIAAEIDRLQRKEEDLRSLVH